MTKGGVLIGVGAHTVGQIPGPQSANLAAGIGGFSTFYPVMGTTLGAKYALKYMKKLKGGKK